MKKIILGCAAVLLSLGLLAGCNNDAPIEEAVLINVDSSATVVVGDTLELPYTVSPEKAEVVAASDNEDVVTAVAQEGTLYLEGVTEGSAVVTLVGTYKKYAEANTNISVKVVPESEVEQGPEPQEGGDGDTGTTEPGEQVVALSVNSTLALVAPEDGGDPANPVKIEYEVTPTDAEVKMEITEGESYITLTSPEEAVAASLAEAWYVTPVTVGSAEIKVTATAEGYTSAEATIKVTVYEAGTEPAVFESYAITVNLQTTSGSAFPDPGGDYSVWIQSSYDGSDNDNWGSAHQMTYVGSGVYEYTYTGVPGWSSGEDGYDTNIIAGHEDEPKWENFNASVIKLRDTTSLTGKITDEFTITSALGDDWETVFPPETSQETTFYLVLADASKGADTTDTNAQLEVWFNTSTSTLCWDGVNYCKGTQTTDSTSVRAWYSALGTTMVNHNDWFNASCGSAGMNFGGNLTIPSDADGIPVFIVGGWCSDAWASGTEWWNPATDTTSVWKTLSQDQTIEQFIAANDLNSLIGNSN